MLVQITTSSLDCLIQVALDQFGLIEQTGRKIDITVTIIISSLATLRRSKLTHPCLLTLEHEALAVAFAAFLHSYRQQRVKVAAVQHSFDLHDTAQRYRVQFCLSKSDQLNVNSHHSKSLKREKRGILKIVWHLILLIHILHVFQMFPFHN